MARGISLHLGVGAGDDACAMTELASALGYETTTLLTERAVARRAVATVRDAALRLHAGDAFMLSASGRRAAPAALAGLWSAFRPGVVVSVVLDGSSAEGRGTEPAGRPHATVVTLRACGPGQRAGCDARGGLFTRALVGAWDEGRFRGGHRDLIGRVRALLPERSRQTPGLSVSGRADRALLARPFALRLPATATDWQAARAVLSRRLARCAPGAAELMSRAVVEGARAAEAAGGGGGGPAFRAFWWGFVVDVGPEDVPEPDLARRLRAVTPPEHAAWVAPIARLAASGAGGAGAAGRPARISMSWYAPGVLVPSA